MEPNKISPEVAPVKSKRKVLPISITLIVIALLVVGIYFLFLSGNKFLQDYDREIDFESLVEDVDFSYNRTSGYTTLPSTIVDLASAFGNVFLVDTGNQRVMVFDFDLENVKNIGEKYGDDGNLVVSGRSEDEEMFSYPGAVTVDASGNVIVVDRLNRKIKTFDASFNYVKAVSIPEPVISAIEIDDSPQVDASEMSFEVLSNGNFVIHALVNNKMLLLDSDLFILKEVTVSSGRIFNIRGSANGIYVINDVDGEIVEYDNDLNVVGKLSMSLDRPYDLCTVGNKVVVSDRGAGVLKVLDLDTNTVSTGNVADGFLPTYIACDVTGDSVFVFDDDSSSLLKVSLSSFNIEGEVPSEGVSDLKKGAPGYVAINPLNGDVAVADAQSNLVLILDSDLELKLLLGSKYGDSADAFKFPAGVSYGADGKFYLLDRLNRKIKVYDSSYALVDTMEDIGNSGMDMHVLDNGNVLYGDDTTNTVTLLSSDGSVVDVLVQGPIDFNNNKGVPMPAGEFGSPHGLGYHNDKYYVVDEAFPVDGSKYHVMINVFDSDRNFIKRYDMPIPNSFGLSETIGLYDSMIVIPSNEENLLYFYDMEKEEIVDKLELTHEIDFTVMEIDVSADESYAIVSNQKDGKIFKIDLNKRKIIDERRVALYYENL